MVVHPQTWLLQHLDLRQLEWQWKEEHLEGRFVEVVVVCLVKQLLWT